jgi:hypothetical protein
VLAKRVSEDQVKLGRIAPEATSQLLIDRFQAAILTLTTLRPAEGQLWVDAVEKRFLGNLCATLIQNEGQKAQVRFKKPTPMIRLLRSSRMAPTFST